MDELRIRVAGTEDVAALANLVTELGYPSSVEDMRQRFEGISSDPSYETFVVESGEEVVGMVGIHLERTYEADGSCARIMALVVSSEHRGQGTGQALISAAEEWAWRIGYEATGYRFYKAL